VAAFHLIRGGGPTLNERAGPLPPSKVGEGSLLNLLSALKGEDSHGTAPLGWEFQVCRPVGMTGLLAGPSCRYSYPGMGFRVTVFARNPLPAA